MRSFYYIIDGKTYFTVCRGPMPSRLSPVWNSPSTSVWIVPGTFDEEYHD